QYDSDPWVPNIDPDSGGQGDQKKAAQSYADVYGVSATKNSDKGGDSTPANAVTMPELSTAYDVAPDFVPGSPGGASDAMPTLPDSDPFVIDLGTLRTAEQTWVDECAIATEGYESTKEQVWAAINDPNLF